MVSILSNIQNRNLAGEVLMQFHLNGFQPGDPEIADPAERVQAPGATGAVP
jgi:hypothetical protein